MIDTKALREKILDLAMRGKLVPQDPNDEPAGELLKRIKAEKEELIKQKKIKRDKNETEIFKGDDGLHYEKFADGTVKEVEVPYELPEGWEWARINSIYWNLGQRKPDSEFFYLDTGSVNNSVQKLNVAEVSLIEAKKAPSRARKIVQHNSIIFSTVRSYLKNIAIVDINDPQNYIASTAFIVLDSLFQVDFLLYLLLSRDFLAQVEQRSTGSNYPAISEGSFNTLFVPVPPIEEQTRIGSKIRDLFIQVEDIEAEQKELVQISVQLKQKVLDVAMQGKLVPQDPNDEPASVLLEKIRAEKQKLFEEGKLKKKDLVETEIVKGDDNTYYEKLVNGEFAEVEFHYMHPKKWVKSKLSDMVIIIPTKKYQIKQSEISIYGLYPVISQSANAIEGYSDARTKVFEHDQPVVVFGDHTRNVKFVSENFIVGADGVKILVPIYSNAAFLKLQIEQVLPFVKERGYARHWSYLEKEWISTPSISLQEKIINMINQFDEYIDIFF